jgi:hypothetical protein
MRKRSGGAWRLISLGIAPVLGAELEALLLKSGGFEIKAAGRFVSSFGMSRTWPLEGFAGPLHLQGASRKT